MIANFFYGQLPQWARPSHPMMRYILGQQSLTRSRQALRLVLMLIIALAVVGLAYAATLQTSQSANPSYREFMYYPLVGTTLLMQILGLAITTNSIALERQKGTWDSLQITLVGAPTSIRARWFSVFYRLRWLLLALVVGRLGYLALLMRDMTDFEGRAIDVRIIGIAPEVSLEVAVFLLAALMTAAILQPFVALAFDAGLGMLVATLTQRRAVGILTTVTLMGLRVGITLAALFYGNRIIGPLGTTSNIIEISSDQAWLRTLLLVTQGDLSLRILNLETLGNLWADLENGIYLGGIVLALVVAQAVIANGMVLFAAWRSGKPSRSG
jgi:hypothetical protein